MDNGVTIKAINNQRSELAIHPEKMGAINLGDKKFAYLSFGNQKQYIKIRPDRGIPPENIILSQNLITGMHLPDYPIYEICANQNEIIVGPSIGLLVNREDRKLTGSQLNRMTVCVMEYSKLHGSVVVFALDKIDKRNLLIEGYCYNPITKGWQGGIFPYPSAIYRTIGLSSEWKNHFLSVMGDKIFNNRFFDKWQTVQWFSKEPGIGAHIPDTVLYQSPRDVFEMLERFPEVYLKPKSGLQGRGIVKISAENRIYILKFRENGANNIMTSADPDEVSAYLQKRFKRGRYLVQQAVNLIKYKGSIVDFRCILQKNQSNAWQCRAVIGRAGVKDSVVSNISNGGTAFPAVNILRKTLGGSEESIDALIQEIADFALTVCDKLNEFGINCGTLGLDIGVDDQGTLWLIEINNRDPDPGIALDIRDTRLYYALRAGPLFYAKYLAGFPDTIPPIQ